MPYPSKINPQTIIATALEQLERGGMEGLALRSLAAELGVTPRALYNHFPSQEHLKMALAEAGLRQMREAMEAAIAGAAPRQAVVLGAQAFVQFALEHRALYSMMMGITTSPPERDIEEQALWAMVCAMMGRLLGPARAVEAAVSIWAFLHGYVLLVQAHMFNERKPNQGIMPGLEALLNGLEAASSPIQA